MSGDALWAALDAKGWDVLYTELDADSTAPWTVVNHVGAHRTVLATGATAREALERALAGAGGGR